MPGHGASVTVLQSGERIMERFDADMVKILEDACSTRGMEIRTGVNPVEIKNGIPGPAKCFSRAGTLPPG
ncbi:MAG: NAD-binding protein [Desulfatiglandaceae bacterium]